MNLKLLNSSDFVIFTSRDYALHSGVDITAASHQLSRLKKKGVLVQVTRGLWANTAHPYYSPLAAVPYLLGVEQGYVSFLTAMHRHGLISQIPQTVQVATTGRPRRLSSSIGEFEFFQIDPSLMQEAIEWSDTKLPYLMATAEKSLLDTLYLSTRKGKRFQSLPELDMEGFSYSGFRELLDCSISNPLIKRAINARIS